MISFRGIFKGFLAVFFALLLIYCSSEQEVGVYSISYAFSESPEGWTGDFADYPLDSTGYYLHVDHDTLPYNINADSTRKALRVSGINHSDDLFMFLKRKISGLRANTTYQLLFNVRVASNAPTGAAGIGGAPGESVYLKVGAAPEEPERELSDDGYYRMNLDKGNQAEPGEDMVVIGHMDVAASTTEYTILVRNNSESEIFATSNAEGELWVIVGTDSGYEGTTTLYYTQIDVFFNEVD